MKPEEVRRRGQALAGVHALRHRVGAAATRLRQYASGRVRNGLAALARHRHGTWLLLFGLLFTLLWLAAGWAGMANGIGRGMLVGIATPFAVSTLFPLRRLAPTQPAGSR